LKFLILFILWGFSAYSFAETTYIQHIIKNDTPFEFYYNISPSTEIPTAFSCNCSGIIGPKEQHICDCYSQLEITERRYHMDYMRNTSPTYRLSATHTASSDVAIIWTLLFDPYWDWLNVKITDRPIQIS
jgi:hypothetical protein